MFSRHQGLAADEESGGVHVQRQAEAPRFLQRLRHVRRFKEAMMHLDGVEALVGIDVLGNLWLSARDGVHCHANDGSLLGKFQIPETVANVCFGGPKRNRLFICASTSLYAVFLNTQGAPRT